MKNSLRPLGVSVNTTSNMRVQPAVSLCGQSIYCQAITSKLKESDRAKKSGIYWEHALTNGNQTMNNRVVDEVQFTELYAEKYQRDIDFQGFTNNSLISSPLKLNSILPKLCNFLSMELPAASEKLLLPTSFHVGCLALCLQLLLFIFAWASL